MLFSETSVKCRITWYHVLEDILLLRQGYENLSCSTWVRSAWGPWTRGSDCTTVLHALLFAFQASIACRRPAGRQALLHSENRKLQFDCIKKVGARTYACSELLNLWVSCTDWVGCWPAHPKKTGSNRRRGRNSCGANPASNLMTTRGFSLGI